MEFFASCGKSFCVGFVCWALAPFAVFCFAAFVTAKRRSGWGCEVAVVVLSCFSCFCIDLPYCMWPPVSYAEVSIYLLLPM